MKLTPKQRDAMVWLGEPPTPTTFVADEMLKELAALGIVEYDPAMGSIKFTDAGRRAFRDTVLWVIGRIGTFSGARNLNSFPRAGIVSPVAADKMFGLRL